MLQKLRDKTSGWIATIILGLLMIPFVFVVDQGYLTGGAGNYVARVQAPPSWWSSAPGWWPASMLWRHHEVSTEEFRVAFDQARNQQRQAMGESFDPREFETVENKRLVLDRLIDQRVMQLESERVGITVGDAALKRVIEGIPAFQADGKFDPARYQLALASQSPPQTPTTFQEMVRTELLQSMIPEALASSAFVTPGETTRLMKLLGETRDVDLVIVTAPENTEEVTEAQIQAWYDGHKQNFRKAETVTLEYVDIDANRLPPPPPVEENTLRQRYEQERSRFISPEQRLASHILIQVPADADEATRKAAEDKATALAEQARSQGADFGALAQANSDDPGSKDADGDLGWVDRGVMVKPFEDALFSMQDGEVRGPVKTDFGYHVLQLRGIRGGEGKSFDEVREELAREQAEADRERAFNDLAGRLVDLVYRNPESLQASAAELGLEVQRLGPFSRDNASGIAANPAVLREAFSETLLQDRTVSDPIDIGTRHSVLIQVVDHAPEQEQPLAEARDAVIAAIRADRARAEAESIADALLAEVEQGGKLLELAQARELQGTHVPGMQRGMPMPSQEANEAVFAVQRPGEGKVAPGKVALGEGAYVVFAVTQVTDGDSEELPQEQRTMLQQQLAQLEGAASVQDFISAARKRYRVRIFEERL